MKKSVVLLCCLLTCVGLTACQGKGASSKGEEYWSAARKAESFENYMAEHGAEFDLEALKQEVSSADSSNSQPAVRRTVRIPGRMVHLPWIIRRPVSMRCVFFRR